MSLTGGVVDFTPVAYASRMIKDVIMRLKSDEFSFVFLRRLRFGDGRRPIAL
jgi:hypothetical protein